MAYFRGELIHGRSFPFQKLITKRPGAYTRWGLLSEFYGIITNKKDLTLFRLEEGGEV